MRRPSLSLVLPGLAGFRLLETICAETAGLLSLKLAPFVDINYFNSLTVLDLFNNHSTCWVFASDGGNDDNDGEDVRAAML